MSRLIDSVLKINLIGSIQFQLKVSQTGQTESCTVMAYLNFWSEHHGCKTVLPKKHSGGPQLEFGNFSSLRFFFFTKCDIYKILFSCVINLLLTKLVRDRTGRISTLGLFNTELATLRPYCQDLNISRYSPSTALALGQ